MAAIPIVSSADLDAEIERRLLGRPMPRGRRLLGVEYERLVLEEATGASAPLDFVRQLMTDLVARLDARPMVEGGLVKGLHTADFDLTMEPGGQLELTLPPHDSLAAIDSAVLGGIAAIEAYLAPTPYAWVGLGHAPCTPAAELGLLPRARYRIMDARMPQRGALTRHMMRATAGFQLTYDVTDRADAGRKLALLYRLSPVLVALTANSRQVAGADSGYASYRHHVWLHTDRDRTGVPPGCLRAETAIEGYVAFARRARMLFFDRGGEVVEAPDLPLEESVARGEVSGADLDLHLSSLFPHVRIRDHLEVRCFDSVDWPRARGVLALVSGLIYCEYAFAAAWELSAPFLVEEPSALDALHEDAARRGLAAVSPAGQPFHAVAGELLRIARRTLAKTDCHWSDPTDLDAVAAHLAAS